MVAKAAWSELERESFAAEESVEPETGVGALGVETLEFLGPPFWIDPSWLPMHHAHCQAYERHICLEWQHDNTFVVVHVIIAPIPSLSIPFNHIVLSLVISFLEMLKFKDAHIRIEGASLSIVTRCLLLSTWGSVSWYLGDFRLKWRDLRCQRNDLSKFLCNLCLPISGVLEINKTGSRIIH